MIMLTIVIHLIKTRIGDSNSNSNSLVKSPLVHLRLINLDKFKS